MAEVKLRALGLREVDFGDFDRYLTVLTEDGRKVEILCKNARRGKKQNPAARQFCYSEFVLSERRGRYTLREADFVHSFFPLSQDIERYALACYLAEVAAALTTPDEDNPAICRLLLHALYALEGKKRETALVKAAFEWRVMAESGYAPDLSDCGVCGNVIEQPPVYFSVRASSSAAWRRTMCSTTSGAGLTVCSFTGRWRCRRPDAETNHLHRERGAGGADASFV